MQAADWIRVVEIIGQIIGPLFAEMYAEFRRGGDPFAVLERERVEAIVPSPLKSELALLRAKARAASHAPDHAPSPADSTARTNKAG